jgi:hypothetical protein
MPTTTDLDLVVEALRARAEQRQRAGTLLSTKLAEQRAGGTDVRSSAVKVIDELDAAHRLAGLADDLEAERLTLHRALSYYAHHGADAPTPPPAIPVAVVESNPASAVDVQKAAIVAAAGETRTAPSAPSEDEVAAAIAAVQAADEGVDGKLEDVDGLEIDVLDGDDNRGAADLAATLAVLDAADADVAVAEAGV